jgi:hypothetical protein
MEYLNGARRQAKQVLPCKANFTLWMLAGWQLASRD